MCCKLKFSLLLLPLILEALIELKDLCWLYFVCYCDWSLILSPTLLCISHFIHRTLFLWNHDSDQLKALIQLRKCLQHVADVSQVLSVLLQLKNIGLWLWWRIALKLYLSVCKCCSQELDYYYKWPSSFLQLLSRLEVFLWIGKVFLLLPSPKPGN